MPAAERIQVVLNEVEMLLAEIKAETSSITIDQARILYSAIREAEGWLQSARKLLAPPGVL